MSVHVVMSPSLKGGAWVVGVVAVDFDHLVEDTASSTQMFIAQVVSQHQKNLAAISRYGSMKL